MPGGKSGDNKYILRLGEMAGDMEETEREGIRRKKRVEMCTEVYKDCGHNNTQIFTATFEYHCSLVDICISFNQCTDHINMPS